LILPNFRTGQWIGMHSARLGQHARRDIFILFFKKNAEQSENKVEFLKFRKYNTLQSCKKAQGLDIQISAIIQIFF